MNTILSQKQLGRRIAELRKRKGMSQEDLARDLNISRPSVTQIELGNRGIDTLELQKLSQILQFSLDKMMSEEFNPDEEMNDQEDSSASGSEERISAPRMNVQKFSNVLLYILEHCAGKPNVGETVLYKLLYFSDFNYYELYEEHLTGARYRKLPYGPVPQKIDSILNQMLAKGKVQRIKTEYHGYTQIRYLPLEKADLSALRASEKETIDKVIEQMSDWSAAAISNYSHHDIPWLASREGEEISYELAFYRELPYSVRNYGDELDSL